MGTQSEQDYFPTLDLSSTQADASSHVVQHNYLVFPGEPPYVGSKPRRNFIAILGTSCSPHYLSWPSKGGAGWKWSLYLGQILICFFPLLQNHSFLFPLISFSGLPFNCWLSTCLSFCPSALFSPGQNHLYWTGWHFSLSHTSFSLHLSYPHIWLV